MARTLAFFHALLARVALLRPRKEHIREIDRVKRQLALGLARRATLSDAAQPGV